VRAREGDVTAFETLVQRCREPVYRSRTLDRIDIDVVDVHPAGCLRLAAGGGGRSGCVSMLAVSEARDGREMRVLG